MWQQLKTKRMIVSQYLKKIDNLGLQLAKLKSRPLRDIVDRENAQIIFHTPTVNEIGKKNEYTEIRGSDYFALLKYQISKGYVLVNRENHFFSHRIVLDIANIICFAQYPKDTELFMQIYYKLELYLTKNEAKSACDMSSMKGITILEAAIQYGN